MEKKTNNKYGRRGERNGRDGKKTETEVEEKAETEEWRKEEEADMRRCIQRLVEEELVQ